MTPIVKLILIIIIVIIVIIVEIREENGPSRRNIAKKSMIRTLVTKMLI